MQDARKNHDTRHIEMAIQEAEVEQISQEALDRQYCIECNHSVDPEEYPWKFIGVGGFLTGPFCGKRCQFAWLASDTDE